MSFCIIMNNNNISIFSNVNNYLPIFNGAIITELLFVILILCNIIDNKIPKMWYKTYTITAVIADIFIIVIGIILARLFYYVFFTKYSLFNFIILAVIIQTIHDLFFALFIYYFPKNKSKIIDLFKSYSKYYGFAILFWDTVMIIMAILFASIFNTFSLNTNIILTICLIYLFPYFLGSF